MTAAAKSILYFGIYLYAIGLILIFMPNFFLKILNLAPTTEVWIRIMGVLAFNIGYLYHCTARANNDAFFKLTLPPRILVFIAFFTFALLQYTKPVIIAFGAIDLLGAFWTWRAIKQTDTT